MASRNPIKHLRPSDLRGIAQLATQATVGVTHIAEGVHQSVLRTIGAKRGPTPGGTGGVSGLVYQGVRGVARLLGQGVDGALTKLLPLLEAIADGQPSTPQREAVLAALNGVLGDRLLATGNPFATPMTLRYQGRVLNPAAPGPLPEATGRLLLLLHGLCMNDLQWQAQHRGTAVDHGAALAARLGYTPVYLRYNSGLHVSQNGRALAAQLEQLAAHWPVALEELSVVAHSMGGLLIRSAVVYARLADMRWPDRLKNIVFLGTPHHGAPLERAGNWVDVLLGGTPYSAPFAKLGQLRSAGITDLRFGHVLDADWQGHDRFQRKPDTRQNVPLPADVACYAVAATTAPKRGLLSDRLIGDGLVPLRSALGQHDDDARSLAFATSAQWIAYRTNHMQLLSSPEVTQQMLLWLGSAAAPAAVSGP